jgi:hypothetical protein
MEANSQVFDNTLYSGDIRKLEFMVPLNSWDSIKKKRRNPGLDTKPLSKISAHDSNDE